MKRHTSFPLTFVTTGRHLLLVGGGDQGTNRLETALRFDWERITFVAPDPTHETRELAKSDQRVSLHERDVEEADVEGVDLVIESTMDMELGERLAAWCRPRRIPLNAMDKLDYCDIYYQALILRGPLMLTISSSGEAPALAALLRRLLEERIGPGWCNAGMLMAEARRALPQNATRMKLMKGIAQDQDFLNCIADNNIEGMRERIADAISRMSD